MRIGKFVLLLFAFVSACSTKTYRDSDLERVSAETSAPALNLSSVPESAAKQVVVTVEVPNTNHDYSLKLLIEGNKRFFNRLLRSSTNAKEARLDGVTFNKPYAAILSCSDARTAPELIFDQKLGDVYVVRTAGESADASVIASLEFAVRQYGINLIYVLGHNHCDVVSGAVKMPASMSTGSSHLDMLNQDIRSHLVSRLPESTSFGETGGEESENAIAIANMLGKTSNFLRERIAAGKLRIVSGLYKIETGRVQTF